MMDAISKAMNAETGISDEQVTITSEELERLAKGMDETAKNSTEDTLEGDREFVQNKIRDAMNQATEMLPGLVGLAKIAESPNLYNSASKFLDSLSNLGTTLIDIRIKTEKHSKDSGKKDDESKPEEGSPESEVLGLGHEKSECSFQGTTEDFLDMVLSRMNSSPVVIEAENRKT